MEFSDQHLPKHMGVWPPALKKKGEGGQAGRTERKRDPRWHNCASPCTALHHAVMVHVPLSFPGTRLAAEQTSHFPVSGVLVQHQTKQSHAHVTV